jgi:hypothetical protein
MEENRLFPQFIDIKPLGEDMFESGSQKRTAESIASHIKEKMRGLKLIGLDGEYGSGKSNVIEIIKKELSATHHVFVYEAWSHQEDLQRRSFLEELTGDLEDHKMFKSGKWKEKLKSLLAKKKETTTTTVPKLSPSIIISFFVIVLLPVAKVISDATTAEWAKLLIAGSPFILGLIVWILGVWIDPKKFNLTHLLYIYKDKDLQTTVNETVAEKEPSVTEFRKWMEELSDDLKKDVIVVFDNMDRLPPDKVQILWSLVHTFFSERHYKKISVIVPFDRNQIREVFDKEGAIDLDKSRHFIEKTFPVLFTVSPPVLTDWKALFKAKYTAAFGNSENEEYNLVKNIFDLYEEKITPRKIISFLNELVAVKLTWREQIPLRYVALFSLNKEQIAKDPFKVILGMAYLNKARYLFKSDDAVADYIAALAYNIPVEMARQVTVSRQILICIRETNVSRLLEISAFGNFWEIVDEVYSKEDIDIVPAAASLLGLDQALNKENHNVIISDIWNVLAEKQIGSPVDEQALTETHKILLEKAGPSKLQKLAEHLLTEYRISRNFKGRTFFQAMDDMDRFIKEKGIHIDLLPLIRDLSLGAEAFIDYVNAAKDKCAYFKVSCNNTNLDQYLSEKISEGFQGTEILPYVIDKYDFPNLKAELENLIRSDKLGAGDVDKLFTAYKTISNTNGTLPAKLTDQTINALFALTEQGSLGYYEISAMRLARGRDFNVSGGPSQVIFDSTELAFVDQVASRIEYYLSFGEILKRSVLSPTPLLVAVAQKLVEDGSNGWELNISEILPLFEKIVNAIGTTDQQLFAALDRWSASLQGILNTGNIQELIPTFRIYSASVAKKSELSGVIKEAALKFIEEQDQANFYARFIDETSYGFQLLYFLLGSDLLAQMPNKVLEAYKECLEATAQAAAEQPTGHPEAWHEFYRRADKRQVEGTIKNIRDAFQNNVNMTPGKFLFFEELFRNQGGLQDKAGDTTRRLLTPVAADSLCLEKIIEHKDFYLVILSNAGNDLFDFIKKVRKSVENNPTNEANALFSRDLNKLLTGRIVIYKARYFADSQSEDVTDAIKQRAESDRNLHFKIGNDLPGNDPLPGTIKKLELEYEFDGDKKHIIIDEHEWLNVPFD